MQALHPDTHITVAASAGTGKTYLLVSRLLRLLIEDTAPNSIVAITFTRKAAGEMHERLDERLYQLAAAGDEELIEKLQALGLDSSYAPQARRLYERLLLQPEKVKITTFHAFCHELLQHFPLEAGINPGFELLESSTLVKHQAWQRLLEHVTHHSHSTVNEALERLFAECSTPAAVEELLLNDFIEHRSDWWAFTEEASDPVTHAYQKTRERLGLGPAPKENTILPAPLRDDLQAFAALLGKHGTKTNLAVAHNLSHILEKSELDLEHLIQLHSVFFTNNGELRKRSQSKAQASSMGDAVEARFLALHVSLSEEVEQLLDRQRREHTAKLSLAWYTVGNELLNLFQTLKQEQDYLDFADLEWQVYKLLSDREQSTWVQYKLDQRIDHILIDEFQDTNPTQWHMLYPLMEEITAPSQRRRSLFIVGDSKQSIYGFRRAAPDLFFASQAWLAQRPSTHQSLRLDSSRRSSPAIIHLINQVFSDTESGNKLIDFQQHDTHHRALWGYTELLPLIPVADPGEETDATEDHRHLRNPLEKPRIIETDQRYRQEGELIARHIQQLVKQGIEITDNQIKRPVRYGDIMILLKKRRHVADYENALQAAGIPFIGTQRKSLLNTLEVQDMISLCNTLLTPHSNLALAVVLRSPIFSCNDEDLMTLATCNHEPGNSWQQRLDTLAEQNTLSPALARAHRLLRQWRALAGKLPVHDLLDHIYHQGQVIARYTAAFPSHYVTRVRANLTRFIELALEIDSGRYPSLPKFIYRLDLLVKRDESPDELQAIENNEAVKLLTIHSAKGLEAPVVFLADASNQERRARRHHPLIDWPAESKRPHYFFLSGMHRDSISKRLIANQQQKEATEDVNLLYVAMTRARQILYISGVAPRKGDWKTSWYGLIAQQVQDNFAPQMGWRSEYGEQSKSCRKQQKSSAKPVAQTQQYIIPAAVKQTEPNDNHSQQDSDTEAAAYGDTLHRLLDLLSSKRVTPASSAAEVRIGANVTSKDIAFDECWREAVAVYTEPGLQQYFDDEHYLKAFNEVNVNTLDSQGRQCFGIIDRLILSGKEATIIDYKSRQNLPLDLNLAAQQYRQQLRRYYEAVQLLYPDKTVRAAILFTTQRQLVELEF